MSEHKEDFNAEEFVRQCEKEQEENLHKPAPPEIYEDVPWYRRLLNIRARARTRGSQNGA
jgi:hypothetical protein